MDSSNPTISQPIATAIVARGWIRHRADAVDGSEAAERALNQLLAGEDLDDETTKLTKAGWRARVDDLDDPTETFTADLLPDRVTIGHRDGTVVAVSSADTGSARRRLGLPVPAWVRRPPSVAVDMRAPEPGDMGQSPPRELQLMYGSSRTRCK